MQSLRVLRSDGNVVAVALAEALGKNSTLERLTICSSVVGPLGFSALGTALGKNATLKELLLRDNLGIADAEAVAVLVEALGVNKTLVAIDFLAAESITKS